MPDGAHGVGGGILLRFWTLATSLLLTAALGPALVEAGADADGHATLATDHDDYLWPLSPSLVPVCFTFTNTGDGWVYFGDAAPWHIETADGDVVWRADMAAQVVTPVAPGESHRDCWRGMRSDGGTAGPGGYVVVWTYATEEPVEVRELRAPFMVSDPLVHPA